MATNVGLPAGFVLDKPNNSVPPLSSNSGLPDGFILDNPQKRVATPQGLQRTVLEQGLQGATFGFADEITDRVGAGLASILTDEKYSDLLKEARNNSKERLRDQMEQRPVASIASNLVGGLAGGIAGGATKAGASVSNSLRTGGAAARIAKGAAVGAATGAAYGAGTAEDGAKTKGAGYGALFGGFMGGAFPGVGAAVSGIKNAIMPKISSPEVVSLAQKAIAEGIPLRRSQIGDSRAAKVIASVTGKLPFSGAAQFGEKQQTAFNKAALAKAGIEAEKATPDILNAADDIFNKKFADAISKTQITIDDNLLNKFGEIEQEATKRLGADGQRLVRSYIDDLLNSGGALDGQVYQNTRANLGKMANAKMQSDPFVGGLLKDMQKALDGAAMESLPESGKRQWENIRKQYGAYKTVQKAMNNTGASASIGNISPAALANAAKSGNPNYAKGAGELNDLARIGSRFIKDSVPDSGTAERLSAYGALTAAPFAPQAVAAAAGGIGLGRAFNAIDTAQPLVRSALMGAPVKAMPSLSIPAAAAVGSLAGKEAKPAIVQKPVEPETIKLAPLPEKQSSLQGADGVEEIDGGRLLDTITSESGRQKAAPLIKHITEAARIAGVSPKYMLAKARIESGFNPNASAKTSSAKGLYQFTKGTWTDMVNKYGVKTGIGLKDIMNPRANAIMAGLLTRENKDQLEKTLGRKTKDSDLYLAHFLGVNGAMTLLDMEKNYTPAAKIMPAAAKANRAIFFTDEGKPRTPLGVIRLVERKLKG